MGIKDYLVAGIHCTSRALYTAGQSYFANRGFFSYAFRNNTHPASYVFSGVAVAANFCVNCLTRFPAIVKTFGPITHAFVPAPDPYSELNNVQKSIDYLFQASGHLSNIFNSLGAYFGTVVTIETLIKLLSNKTPDEPWEQTLIDCAALAVAISAGFAFYAYEFQTIKHNGKRIANNIGKCHSNWNKHMTYTVLISCLNTIANPLLAKYWTGPALGKIPYSDQLLRTVGHELVTWVASVSALTTGFAMVPSVYDFISLPKTELGPAINTCKMRGFSIAAYTAGAIDSLFAGASLAYALINLGSNFDLDPYSNWIIGTIPFSISTCMLNMTFSFMPGYQTLMKDIYTYKETHLVYPTNEDNHASTDTDTEAVSIPIPINPSHIYSTRTPSLLFSKSCREEVANSEHHPDTTQQQAIPLTV